MQQQEHYKGYCLTRTYNLWQIDGFANVFYSLQTAKAFIDILELGITKVR